MKQMSIFDTPKPKRVEKIATWSGQTEEEWLTELYKKCDPCCCFMAERKSE